MKVEHNRARDLFDLEKATILKESMTSFTVQGYCIDILHSYEQRHRALEQEACRSNSNQHFLKEVFGFF